MRATLSAFGVACDSVANPIHLPELLTAMAKIPKAHSAAQQNN
jgi:hypothetical protein